MSWWTALTPDELDEMPTISSAHTCDLKIDDGQTRVWLSRMTPEDGEVYPVQVEELQNGRWVEVTEEVAGGVIEAGEHVVRVPTSF